MLLIAVLALFDRDHPLNRLALIRVKPNAHPGDLQRFENNFFVPVQSLELTERLYVAKSSELGHRSWCERRHPPRTQKVLNPLA